MQRRRAGCPKGGAGSWRQPSQARPRAWRSRAHPGSDLKHFRMSRQAGWIFPENSQVTSACRKDTGRV